MNISKGYRFIFNSRLGIHVPEFDQEWESYSVKDQSDIIQRWDQERAKIPDQIRKLEHEIIRKQDAMFEMSFEEYLIVHRQIVDLASRINDLNIWYRTEGHITNHR